VIEAIGGRTRTRTWDPLIKSLFGSPVFAPLFFKPRPKSHLGAQSFATDFQTALLCHRGGAK